ncbi:MAG: V-type ATPase 116kDa subunit family protein [Eubacteriales bacterium]|nr:V-type ATPase 116kDa subunit family protein [Eubacteriales bacterium]
MIEKMKFITLTGPKDDIDRVTETYLRKYEIHLENAMTELSDVKNLVPFQEPNPYKELLTRVKNLTDQMGDAAAGVKPADVTLEEVQQVLDRVSSGMNEMNAQKKGLEEKIADYDGRMATLAPFRSLPEDFTQLLNYHFVDFRFGRMPKSFYSKFKDYVYDNFDTIFMVTKQDDQYVYGIYFAPIRESHKIDAVYSSMHFERVFIPAGYKGTPEDAYDLLKKESDSAASELKLLKKEIRDGLRDEASRLLGAEKLLSELSQDFDIRKDAAVMSTKTDRYYIICGWMGESDFPKFEKAIENDPKIVCVPENAEDTGETPPTKLKNPKLFKPYEMYVKMYGLPNYKELDPTIFVAITYSFIFGAMFGDWGQGLCLLILGGILYKIKKAPLFGIISCAGVFSTLFGFLFGSCFGFENVTPALWLRPRTSKITLPGIGSINTVLVVAVVFGMFLILTTMILNIINSKRLGDKEGELFGTNSLTGFIFYTGVVIFIICSFTNHKQFLGAAFIIIFFVVPLAVMFLKEPLTAKLTHKEPKEKVGVGMFIVQSFFEMFETLLSFFSNTLSFIRIGAFAVSHAAMMEVVLMLANGGKNIGVVIGGNIFVMGMEGLIVGIQVLRLEYYEMFSRFYRGDGKEFKPFLKQEKNA